jgi:hypothetical protein
MPPASTQQFLRIKEIKDGVIILKNNALRGVMMVSSINFGLKTQDAQEAIIYQFQQFLNSIDFSVQILVQTRNLNITGYLDKLKDLEEKQTNELLKTQTAEYRKFIGELIEGESIMTKNFYVVVPYSLMEEKSSAHSKLKKATIPELSKKDFQRCKDQLWQRMEFIALGLRGCGLNAMPLTSPELIELFWSLYHPQQAEIGYYPEIPSEIQ